MQCLRQDEACGRWTLSLTSVTVPLYYFWLRIALRACDLLLVLRVLAEVRDIYTWKGKEWFHVLLCTVFPDARGIFVYNWDSCSGIQLRIRKHQY